MKKYPIKYILFLLIIVFFLSCSQKNFFNEKQFTTYYCDAETRTDNNKFFTSSLNSSILFKAGEQQSADFSLSGNYSVKVNEQAASAMDIEIAIKNEEHYRVSIWRYGNEQIGQIVASNSSFWHEQKVAEVADSLGWHKMILDFYIPPNNTDNMMKIYLWNPDTTNIYFDDFTIKKIPPTIYPYYRPQKTLI